MEPMTTAPTVNFDPGSQEFAWHAYERYAELRNQAPVHRLLQPDGTEAWLITRYDDARAALADPRLSKDPRGIREALEEEGLVSPVEVAETGAPAGHLRLPTPDMLSSDPPEHTRLRRLVNRAFTPRRIEGLRPQVEVLAENLLDGIAAEEQVDLLSTFAYPLPITVICELLGVPVSDRERIRRYASQMLQSNEPANESQSVEPGPTFAQYTADLVRATWPEVRRDLPEDQQPNLLHALIVASEDQDRLSITEIVDMIVLLLLAGHETTANLIGNGTLALLRHPDQLDLLVRRPDLIPNATEELLRYDGPVERTTPRFSLERVTIAGVTIPAHRMVYVVIASANRDPEHFERPDQLDISRPRPQHVAFGHGIHFCLGAPLARLEAQIAFSQLLQRFPEMELACPMEDLWFSASGYLVRALRALPVRLHGAGRRPDASRTSGKL